MKQSILAYNRHCKKVLSDKRILAYLLKVALIELKDLSLEEIEPLIEGEVLIDGNTHMLFPRNNEVYLPQGKIVFDLLFTLRFPNSSNKVNMIINVEFQNDAHPHSSDGKAYPLLKRATYYGSVVLAEEKGPIFSRDNYQNIRKVVSIWMNTKVSEDKKGSIKRYNYVESEHKGNYYKDERSHYDLMELVVLNLSEEVWN